MMNKTKILFLQLIQRMLLQKHGYGLNQMPRKFGGRKIQVLTGSNQEVWKKEDSTKGHAVRLTDYVVNLLRVSEKNTKLLHNARFNIQQL